MDGGKSDRHLTLKKSGDTDPPQSLSSLLEDSAREAYARPWHRIERGLRLNRLRLFIEDVAKQYDMTKEEKEGFSYNLSHFPSKLFFVTENKKGPSERGNFFLP
jgi:hypothetical protein